MKERPILFSAPMVRALLAGTKTQTRRICNPAMAHSLSHVVEVPDPQERGQVYNGTTFGDEEGAIQFASPYGGMRDRLWVREAFRFPASLDHLSPSVCGDKALDAGYRTPWAPTQYEADSTRTGEWRGFDTPPAETKPGKLRPGIHMPRWASRILLEITNVRVERLQDISEADAAAEGVATWAPGALSPDSLGNDPSDQFRWLWTSINGPSSWHANPWVWALDFQLSQTHQQGQKQ